MADLKDETAGARFSFDFVLYADAYSRSVIMPPRAPFNAPALRAGANRNQAPDCSDKPRHRYANPCSSQWNYQLNFAPDSRQPDGASADFQPFICDDQDKHQRAAERSQPGVVIDNHLVCRYCVAATEDKRWFREASEHITRRPLAQQNQQYADITVHHRSRYYLTRLCRLCEHREKALLTQLRRSGNNALPIDPDDLPPEDEQDLMEDWPVNRCTCRLGLELGDYCDKHRWECWDEYRKEHSKVKAKSKKFLERIDLVNGVTIEASSALRLHRDRNQLWRACRCGADPIADVRQAEVMQCMACEGIVHLDLQRYPTTIAPDPTPAHHERVRENGITHPHLFAFHRPIMPVPAAVQPVQQRNYQLRGAPFR